MRRLLTCVLVAALIAAAAIPVSARGHTLDADTAALLDDGHAALVELDADGTHRERPASSASSILLDDEGRPARPDAVLAALPELVAERMGARQLTAAELNAADQALLGVDSTSGSDVHPFGHADLDGDGRDEILAEEEDRTTGSTHIRALRGDLTDLWVQRDASAGEFFYVTPDLDGDGGDDFISLRTTDFEGQQEGDCFAVDPPCEETYDATFTWVVQLRSGADGEVSWRQEIPADYHYRSTETEETREVVVTSTDAMLTLDRTADLDDDGVDETIVSRSSMDSYYRSTRTSEGTVIVTQRHQLESTSRTEATATILTGDGAIMAEVTSSGTGFAELRGAGDMVGDDGADLVWGREVQPDVSFDCERELILVIQVEEETCADELEEEETQQGFEVQAVDGTTLAPVWTVMREGFPIGPDAHPTGDLDGDGRDDVLVELDVFLPQYTALSGADGAELWTRDLQYGGGLISSDTAVDGGTHADLVFGLSLVSIGGSSAVMRSTLERVDGATGQPISDNVLRTEVSDSLFGFILVFGDRAADVDGDGVDEVFLQASVPTETGATTHVLVASTISGQEFMAERHDDVRGVFDAGDLDGDGMDDGNVVRFEDDEVDALTFGDGALLWTRSFDAYTLAVGDVDGSGDDEVIEHIHQEQDGHASTILELRDGETLQLLGSRTIG